VNDEKNRQVADETESPHLRLLAAVAIVTTCLYGVIAFLSWRFDFDSPTTEPP